jgi:transposase-like protein
MVKKLKDYTEQCECDHCECDDKMEKPVKVYFCPKCKSTDVGYVFGVKNLLGIIPRMQCKKCGFHLTSFPQWVIEQKELKKANAKASKKKK